uniref:Uncharacterized protein n=1 Tax=Phaseolus vulgaris TaxID=3885 RepID=V7BKQ4_PHAVU|nr:hypothetical protein PHAVU_007G254500g [Phaseolus vulgaris]ESW17618.1 hypothetical protein PHAVU_007G254500g [Phaseolus vulgaris]
MAESLLFSFAESLIGKVTSRAVKEASLALGVHSELQQMKTTMTLIRGVLLDAQQKNPLSSALSEWLRQVKRVFSDAEDIVDDFECEALRKHVVKTYGDCSRKVRHFFSTSNPLVYRLRMAHRIQDINTRLAKLAAQRSMFGLQIIDQDTRVVHVREMTHSHVNPSNVTGREHDKNQIVKLLVQDVHHQTLSVIPIVGMGGLGKTTLAKLVFNDTNIDACFPLKMWMWVCVSNDFELRNVLIKILNSAPNPTRENFNNSETEQLQNRLRNTLQGEKFLLVLDDVWNEDRARWGELKEIIDVGVEGSKILLSTRSHEIATMMHTKSSNSYLLQCLSKEDSRSLFIGEEIVKKCGGLPLALKTVGSSLFSRVDKKEWESIRDNKIWNLKQNEKGILPALKLSYDQLPSYLKPCFASFSLYKEDTDIFSSEVSVLWEALGFLPPPKEGESTIDAARQFLHELWTRSFLSDYEDLGSEYSFKLHDLVHDLATYIAKGEFETIDFHNPKISEGTQHLTFGENNFYGESLLPTGLRTMIFRKAGNNKDFLNTLVSRCKYLRILNLQYSEYESLPRCIGKLKHLRYLSLAQNKKLKELPDSICKCKLQNLQTLILIGCIKLQTLPKGIKILVSLRHLAITTTLPYFPKEVIANLTSLRTFVLFIYCCDKLELSMDIESQIPNLRLKCLGLNQLPQLVTFPQWLQGSANSLESLIVGNCINLEELPNWLPSTICLKILSICNCPNMLSLPDNMHHLTNLKDLEIIGCPELRKRLKPEVGQDWHKISHIKRVYIDESENEEESS